MFDETQVYPVPGLSLKTAKIRICTYLNLKLDIHRVRKKVPLCFAANFS